MFKFFNKIESKQEELIHPDFKVKDGFWKWNYTDFGKYITEKRYVYKDEQEKLKEFGKRFIKYNLITELDTMAEIREQTRISTVKNTNSN